MRSIPLSRRRALAGAAFAPVALASGRLAAQAPLTVRIGFAQIGIDNRQFAGGRAAAIAHAEGYLEREFADRPDVRIAWYFFKGAGPAVNEAFATGQLDFASQGDLPTVIGRASGLRTKILMANGAHAPTYLAVPANGDVQAIKDLRGRKVAIFRGTNNHLSAVKVLKANGLAERDLQVLNMDNATANAALASGDIDAAFGNYNLLALAEQGLGRIAYTTKNDDPTFERHSTILASADFVDAQPEVTGRVVKAITRAAHWSSQEANREAAFAIWARSGHPPQAYRGDFEGTELRYRNSPLIDDFIVGQYTYQAQQAKEYGLIRRAVDPEGWFEPRFLDGALTELGLETYWTRLDAAGRPVGT